MSEPAFALTEAKMFFNGIELPVTSYKRESDRELSEQQLLGHSQHFTIPITLEWNENAAEFFKWFSWRMLPPLPPHGTTRGACLGTFAWRLLAELQKPELSCDIRSVLS